MYFYAWRAAKRLQSIGLEEPKSFKATSSAFLQAWRLALSNPYETQLRYHPLNGVENLLL